VAATLEIATLEELVACFRRIDRKEVELAEGMTFPLSLRRLVTWSYGSRTFLVTRDRFGVVFRRTPLVAARVSSMCTWCQRMRGRGEVQLLSARVTARRTIGQYLCADLSCFVAGDGGPFEPPDAAVRRVERALGRMQELVDMRLRGSADAS
jgi:hypothetical protein